jgi:hypothetical protein
MGEQDMKTLSLIAVAGLASAAAADQMWAANPSSSFSNQQSGFASGTYDYNFGETAHWDLQGDPDNVVVTLDLNALLGGAAGADAFVTGLGWDVTVTSNDPSWLSEATYNFNGEIFVTPGIGEDVPGTNSYSSGGILDLDDDQRTVRLAVCIEEGACPFQRVAQTIEKGEMVRPVVEPHLEMVGLVGAQEGKEHGLVLCRDDVAIVWRSSG